MYQNVHLREGDGAGSGAASSVDDGPQRASGLGDQADGAAGQETGQGDGTAKVGSRVLDGALEGGGGTVDDGETGPRWLVTARILYSLKIYIHEGFP